MRRNSSKSYFVIQNTDYAFILFIQKEGSGLYCSLITFPLRPSLQSYVKKQDLEGMLA